jgi:hypothetical protein
MFGIWIIENFGFVSGFEILISDLSGIFGMDLLFL